MLSLYTHPKPGAALDCNLGSLRDWPWQGFAAGTAHSSGAQSSWATNAAIVSWSCSRASAGGRPSPPTLFLLRNPCQPTVREDLWEPGSWPHASGQGAVLSSEPDAWKPQSFGHQQRLLLHRLLPLEYCWEICKCSCCKRFRHRQLVVT